VVWSYVVRLLGQVVETAHAPVARAPAKQQRQVVGRPCFLVAFPEGFKQRLGRALCNKTRHTDGVAVVHYSDCILQRNHFVKTG
jgi:hypothetical protein